jgi:hypothetical protein
MGSPLFPSFEPTQDGPSSELNLSIEPFPPQWKYQDTKMTVRKYTHRGPIILCSGLDWSTTHGEIQQTSSHRKNKWFSGCCSLEWSRSIQELWTNKVSIGISLLDPQWEDPRRVFSSSVHRRRSAKGKIHEIPWEFLLQLQFHLAASESISK